MIKPFKHTNITTFFTFLMLACTYMSMWYQYTDVEANFDGITRAYTPFVNMLSVTKEITINPFFLKTFIDPSYPFGMTILASIIGFCGLSNYFILSPWHIHFIFLILVCLIPCQTNFSFKEKCVFFLLLFFFPPTQIALKTFSLHSWIYLISLHGTLIVVQSLMNKNRKTLYLGMLLLLFSATLKHLGLIFLGVLFIVYIYTQSHNKLKSTIVSIIAVSTVLCFYPPYHYLEYIIETFSRSQKNLYLVPYLIVSCVVILIVFFKSIPKVTKKKVMPSLFSNISGFLFIIILTCVSYASLYLGLTITQCIIVLFIFLIFLVITKYNVNSLRVGVYLLIILFLTVGNIFYGFQIAIISDFYAFALGLALFSFIHESKNNTVKAFLVIIFIIVCNVSPSKYQSKFLQSIQHSIQAIVYYSMHSNPLSWQKSNLRNTKNNVRNIWNNTPLKNRNYFVPMIGMHPHTKNQFIQSIQANFNGPTINKLEKMGANFLSQVDEKCMVNKSCLEHLLHQGHFPIIIHAVKPWYFLYTKNSSSKIIFSHSPINRFESKLENLIGRSNILKYGYLTYNSTPKDSNINIYIHQSILSKLNSPVTQDSVFYDYTLLKWQKFKQMSLVDQYLHTGFTSVLSDSDKLYKSLAEEYFQKASKYFDSQQKPQAKLYLLKALQCNPNHFEAKQDLNILNNK